MWSEKVIRVLLITEQITPISLYKMSWVSEPYSQSKNRTKFELALPNYVKKLIWKGKQALIHQNY